MRTVTPSFILNIRRTLMLWSAATRRRFCLWLALATAWCAKGAPDPATAEHWSLKLFAEQPLPKVKAVTWPRSRVDHFILARLEREGIPPSGDAEQATLLRRLYYDLVGLPPTLEEIAVFEQDCAVNRTAAVARTVDRLLASPDFGMRWGRHWLDVARYGESSGNTRNMAYVEAWRYRNYVVRAFNRNVPYDQFIREQLAGDLLPAATPELRDQQLLGTGFLTVGTKSLGEKDITLYELNLADDQIDVTFHAFLALSANCARCHNHKFDPIPTRDYYALAGIFRSTKNLSVVETNNRKEEAEGMPLGADGMARLVEVKRHEKLMEVLTKESAETAKKRNAMRDELVKAGFDPAAKKSADAATLPPEMAGKMTEFATLEKDATAFKTKLKKANDRAPTLPPFAMAVQDKPEPVNCPLYYKGNEKQPRDEVPRGTLSAIPVALAPIGPRESGRRQLADWIASPENPLTAPVIVNRVWLHLFGRGLVETPDDFGTQGTPPSHPELLDDLTAHFVHHGWNVKALIRELTLSRTYQLSSDAHARVKAATADAANVLLWRASRKPIEFEPVRDTILFLGGTLRRDIMEGSPIKDLAQGVKPQSRELGRNGFLNQLDDTHEYRSIYLPVLRGALLPVQQCFEGADPSSVVGLRRPSIVPTQAGGPSQVDTFDYKPALDKWHDKGAITTMLVSPCGWPAAEQNPASASAAPTRPAPRPRRAKFTSTICTPPCSICSVSTTNSSPIAIAVATSGSRMFTGRS